MKTTLSLLVALSACVPVRGTYDTSDTFKASDEDALESRLADIHYFPKLSFSAREVTGYPSDFGDARLSGDFYTVDVEQADCMAHTVLLLELLQVGYAENGKTLASVPSDEAAKADPGLYDCDFHLKAAGQ